jgi:hypothetical protein
MKCGWSMLDPVSLATWCVLAITDRANMACGIDILDSAAVLPGTPGCALYLASFFLCLVCGCVMQQRWHGLG